MGDASPRARCRTLRCSRTGSSALRSLMGPLGLGPSRLQGRDRPPHSYYHSHCLLFHLLFSLVYNLAKGNTGGLCRSSRGSSAHPSKASKSLLCSVKLLLCYSCFYSLQPKGICFHPAWNRRRCFTGLACCCIFPLGKMTVFTGLL